MMLAAGRILALMVPDDEFETMVARANRLRAEVGELWNGFVVDSHVRGRLYWNPKIPELPAGQESLADEIYELLSTRSFRRSSRLGSSARTSRRAGIRNRRGDVVFKLQNEDISKVCRRKRSSSDSRAETSSTT
jgi:hypothetical protein